MEQDRKGNNRLQTSLDVAPQLGVQQDLFLGQCRQESHTIQKDIKEIRPDEFPLLLRDSKLRPKRLFYRGMLPPSDCIGIGMVGTRRPSSSARELCRRLVRSLQGTKAVVISGLAQGIDSYCHEAALDAGIPTVAVIAQGIEAPLSGDRGPLARRIVEAGGAILTEYEGDAPSYRGTFPARNRIISGLSRTVVLVQSKTKGGALITADYCLQEGKLLLAVPGDFDSEVSSGPNLYLDQGKAKPVFRPESLPMEAGIPRTEIASHNSGKAPAEAANSLSNFKKMGNSISGLKSAGCQLTPDALTLFTRYRGFRKTISEIEGECNFKTVNILAILTELEIAGLVETRDNLQFYFSGAV